MTRRPTFHLLATSLLLLGCGARYSEPTGNALLEGAHASLEQGGLTDADERLSHAGSVVRSDHERRMYEFLRAETDIRTGHANRASERMNRLLEAHPEDPRGHELAGKAHLLLGNFTDASRHFDLARQHYDARDDVRRANDLLALSSGLEAYAHGRLALARDAWARIQDLELRTGVMNAYRFVASDEANGLGTARADSNRPS